MNDEVTRLRQLRKSALKLRALALGLNTGKYASAVYERACVLNWRIARIATGKLRSHPYGAYQKDQGLLESTADRFESALTASVANLRGRGMHVFFSQLTAASRQLSDVRSLTLSTDMSDALGRAQINMRVLVDEVRLEICRLSGEHVVDRSEPATRRLAAPNGPASSYLAL